MPCVNPARLQMDWSRMELLLSRYERIASNEVRELKQMQKKIVDWEQERRSTTSLRQQAHRLEEQLLSGLEQVLSNRALLPLEEQELFDTRVEPVRKLIQTTVNQLAQLPPPGAASGRNPFDLDDDAPAEEENVYESEARQHAHQHMQHSRDMQLRVEEAKAKAEATAQINRDIEDLNQIFVDLATLVHAQHDMVDSIEEHVESAAADVNRGNEQIKKAVRSKNAKVPLVAAVVSGLAVGGPVGVAAGSAIAGVAAAVGGAFAGLYGGRYIKKGATAHAQPEGTSGN